MYEVWGEAGFRRPQTILLPCTLALPNPEPTTVAAGVVTLLQSNDMRARKGWISERPSQVLLVERETVAGWAKLHPEVYFIHRSHYSVEKTEVEGHGAGSHSQISDSRSCGIFAHWWKFIAMP